MSLPLFFSKEKGNKMSESDVAKEQILREVYFNPLSGYGSREQLYRDVKAKGVNISRRGGGRMA